MLIIIINNKNNNKNNIYIVPILFSAKHGVDSSEHFWIISSIVIHCNACYAGSEINFLIWAPTGEQV